MKKKIFPLEGLKVIEMATVIAGPITARLLSDYGAEVIKVEAPKGDLLRTTGSSHAMPIADDHNPLFDLCNTGKKIVGINMKSEAGKEIFFKLLEDADIFITNTRMQSLQKMGIDYESLKARFPKLIYAHFSGFGLKGEETNRPGYDSTAFWMRTGGSMDITTPGSFPVRASFGFGDIATASEFALAILMAVFGREKTGKGTLVATSLMQSGIWCNSVAVMNAQPQYGKKYPVDRFRPGNPLADYYECSDGEYMACMQNDFERDRQLFADVFHFPELNTDPDLASVQIMNESGRVPDVAKKMQQEFYLHTSEEWEEILTDNDIPHELGRHFKNTYKDPQARAMNAFDDVFYPTQKETITTAIPRPPFDFADYGRHPFEKTGGMGRDTVYVLKELGYDSETIQYLQDDGSIV